ncbi:hypothetical protein NDU88_001483 [Pleurodeles waltl]|uniref:Uncharacterized protein n=1 Tax=Pleurodeles waltl TaxID=8319 RepID=A0AAV7UUG4_PLEWA|nr:hypothetical protein NDU88_001483 [Pleurodeles waltl]
MPDYGVRKRGAVAFPSHPGLHHSICAPGPGSSAWVWGSPGASVAARVRAAHSPQAGTSLVYAAAARVRGQFTFSMDPVLGRPAGFRPRRLSRISGQSARFQLPPLLVHGPRCSHSPVGHTARPPCRGTGQGLGHSLNGPGIRTTCTSPPGGLRSTSQGAPRAPLLTRFQGQDLIANCQAGVALGPTRISAGASPPDHMEGPDPQPYRMRVLRRSLLWL